MYSLIGVSKPPGVAGTLDVQMKAKKNHMQILQIKNWLKNVQRFNVTWQLDVEDPTIFINGANTIDVNESSKDYKLTVYGLKQTANKLTVYFKNITTYEFIFYKLVKISLFINKRKFNLEYQYRSSRSFRQNRNGFYCKRNDL